MISDIDYLREQAERCRRLAAGCGDARTAQSLRLMAEDYAARIAEAEATAPVKMQIAPPAQR